MNNWNGLKNKKTILKEGYLPIGKIQAQKLFINMKFFEIKWVTALVDLENVYVTGLCASSCHLRCEHDKDPIGLALKPYHVQISSDRRMLTIQ